MNMALLWPILAAAVFALSHAAGKASLRHLRVPAMLTVRAAAGLVISLPLLVMDLRWPDHPTEWAWLGLSVLLAPVLVNVLYFTGLNRGQLGVQVAVFQTVPVFAMVFGVIAGVASLSPTAVAAATAVVGGCGLLARDADGDGASWVFGLGAAVVMGAGFIVQDHVLTTIDREALIVAQNTAFLTLTSIATGLLVRHRKSNPTNSVAPTNPADTTAATPPPHPLRGVGLAAVSGLLMLVCFDWLKFTAIIAIGPVVTACLLLVRLPMAQILGCLLFAERITRRQYLATVIILAGALTLALVA